MTATTRRPEPSDPAKTASAYVYGVTWADAAIRAGNGIGGADVSSIAHGDVAAIVSEVPSTSVRARRRDLHRHAEILREAFELDTVVPLRFGVLFARGADVVTSFLEPRHDELVALLERFENLAELTVRAFYDEEAVLAEIVRGDRSIERLREASLGADPAAHVRLGEAVVSALAARRGADADRILSALEPLARDDAVEERQTDMEILRAAFLVDREAVAAFDRTMDGLARECEGLVRFKYTGPLPPHHFVTETWAS